MFLKRRDFRDEGGHGVAFQLNFLQSYKHPTDLIGLGRLVPKGTRLEVFFLLSLARDVHEIVVAFAAKFHTYRFI